MKFKSDSGLTDFLRSKSLILPVLLAALGLVLLLFSEGFTANNADGEEKRAEQICSSVSGVGECTVMMTYREVDGESKVYAVAVVCEGADDVHVRQDLTELICSLYGIGSHRVTVLKPNDQKNSNK